MIDSLSHHVRGLDVAQQSVAPEDRVLLGQNRHRAPDRVGGGCPSLDRTFIESL